MEPRERTIESLIRAGAIVTYCTRFAQTKGTHKDKCKSARLHLTIDFPGVSDGVVSDIEKQALIKLKDTLYEW